MKTLSICIKRFIADSPWAPVNEGKKGRAECETRVGGEPKDEKQMQIGSLNNRLEFEIRLRNILSIYPQKLRHTEE